MVPRSRRLVRSPGGPCGPVGVLAFLAGLVFLAGLLLWPVPAVAATTRYVSNTDPTCGGHAPCYATIQAGVSATQAGDTVLIQPGTYTETITVALKNPAASDESTRITIMADPAQPAGSVVVTTSADAHCDGAIKILHSHYVTVRGLTISGANGPAFALPASIEDSRGIRLERNRIVGNGRTGCAALAIGMQADAAAPAVIVNNVIYGNKDAGIVINPGGGSGSYYLVNNTIHANQGHGVWVYKGTVSAVPQVYVVNTAITNNGASPGAGYGVIVGSTVPSGTVHLENNLICGNSLGEINGPAVDNQATGNLTPTGTEGGTAGGVSAAPGCQTPANVYANVNGADGVANTADDDFTPNAGGPSVDHGMDPTTLGLTTSLSAIFQSDFLGTAHRPAYGRPTGALAYDMGAIEWRDAAAPALSFLQPAANAWVRQTVTVQAQATDSGSGVATLTLTAGSQPLTTSLSPSPPASSVTGTASWNTTTFADGATTLTVQAADRAGNATSATRVVIVDNTAPDTQITAGPTGTIADPTAAFTFTGTDNLTPVGSLVFAWRLDGAAWSAFGATTTVTLSNLADGAHTFEVKARDLAGNEDPTPAARSFSVYRLAVTITDPSSGATLTGDRVLVLGTINTAPGEVAVTVNGVAAAVGGGVFAAVVPLVPGPLVLRAVATTASGVTAEHSISVTVSSDPAPVVLTPSPSYGPAPLAVKFSLSGSVTPTSVALDVNGDGAVDFTGSSIAGQVFTYQNPGLYIATVRVLDNRGNAFDARALVNVVDAAALDGLLQGKWAAVKTALRSGNITAAASYIVEQRRADYTAAFGLVAGSLSNVDAILTTIQLVTVRNNAAIYEMRRTDAGVVMSFEIRFAIDWDGIWRLVAF
ncbi:MAG: right-handed parallel beta-helix repeat-containing protein [Candidatus Rokubacteria bacterium]|nr:right-handed parallel beta-helix repeat-containing protein [Candidatus Rokubacteria bacterium]MBI3825053.1 right-handed parallel beta-helix repeat-containing protein [Candidatus Rokubacteria bacterium]